MKQQLLQAADTAAVPALTTAVNSYPQPAVNEVAHLILKESVPLQFLIHANINIQAAAACLAAYWTKRKEIYKCKAFIPLGERVHPKQCDNHGSWLPPLYPKKQTDLSVLFYDHSKFSNCLNENSCHVQ